MGTGSAKIYESGSPGPPERYMIFEVTVDNGSALCRLIVGGLAGTTETTGPTDCYVGNTRVFHYDRKSFLISKDFPNVVGTAEKVISVPRNQPVECKFSTAIWTTSVTTKTFTVSSGGGSSPVTPSRKAATITSVTGDSEIEGYITINYAAPKGIIEQMEDTEPTTRIDTYRLNFYIRCGNGSQIYLGQKAGVESETTGYERFQIPKSLMDDIGAESLSGTAYIEIFTEIWDTNWREYDDVGWSDPYSHTITVPFQNLEPFNVTAAIYNPPEYSDQFNYSVGDLVSMPDTSQTPPVNVIYICIENTTGAWDSTKWSVYALPDIPLANRTQFEVTWQNAIASRGSYISRVRVRYAGMIKTAENPAQSGTCILGTVPASGNVNFEVIATDARGFEGYGSYNGLDILAYERPNISEFLVTRYNYDTTTQTGSADDKGVWAYAGARFNVTSLDGHNSVKRARISNAIRSDNPVYYEIPLVNVSPYNIESNEYYIFRYYNGSSYSDYDTTMSYFIKVEVTDTLDMTTEKIVLLSTEPAILDLKYNGKGLAIGKVAEKDELFEVAMAMEVNNLNTQMSVLDDKIWMGTAGGPESANPQGILFDTSSGETTIKSLGVTVLGGPKMIRNIFISDQDAPTGATDIGEPGDIWIKVGSDD